MARPKNPELRDKILLVAAREFAESGFAGASMASIGRAAAVTKGGVYFHFRTKEELPAAGDLSRFSRSLLERLRALDRQQIKAKLGRWLSKKQIESLLTRRDLILEIAEKRIGEQGEEATLFP